MANTKWLQQSGSDVKWGPSNSAAKMLSQQTNGTIAWEAGERLRKCLGGDGTSLAWEQPTWAAGQPADNGIYEHRVVRAGVGADVLTVENGNDAARLYLFIDVINDGTLKLHAETSDAATNRALNAIGAYFIMRMQFSGVSWNTVLASHRLNVQYIWRESERGLPQPDYHTLTQVLIVQFWSAVQSTTANIGGTTQQTIILYRRSGHTNSPMRLNAGFSVLRINADSTVTESNTNMVNNDVENPLISVYSYPAIIRFQAWSYELYVSNIQTIIRFQNYLRIEPGTGTAGNWRYYGQGNSYPVPNQQPTIYIGTEPIFTDPTYTGQPTAFDNINVAQGGTNTLYTTLDLQYQCRQADGTSGPSSNVLTSIKPANNCLNLFSALYDSFGNMLAMMHIYSVGPAMTTSTPGIKSTNNLIGRVLTKSTSLLANMARTESFIGMAADNNMGLLTSSEQYGPDVNLYKPVRFILFSGMPRY